MTFLVGRYLRTVGTQTVEDITAAAAFDDLIGGIQAHVADPAAMAAATGATITDNSGGSASQTLAAITGGGANCETATKDAVASLADEVNKLVADVAAAKTAIDANNAAIDAILVTLETVKIHATS